MEKETEEGDPTPPEGNLPLGYAGGSDEGSGGVGVSLESRRSGLSGPLSPATNRAGFPFFLENPCFGLRNLAPH